MSIYMCERCHSKEATETSAAGRFCQDCDALNAEDRHLLEEHRRGIKQSALDAQVTDVLLQGLQTDGAHHKQWALWKIGELLGLSHFLNDIDDRGIAP